MVVLNKKHYELACGDIEFPQFCHLNASDPLPCTKCRLAYHPECLEEFGWDEIEIKNVKDDSSPFICPKCLLK